MFVSTLGGDQPLHVNRLSNDHEHLARVHIGTDDETGCIYSILVAIKEVVWEPTHSEIMFFVVRYPADGSRPEEIMDGAETQSFLHGNDRRRCRDLICRLVAMLLEDVTSDVLVMNTVRTHLPEKALAKYHAIQHIMLQAGFVGGEVDPYHGARMWMFER